MATFLDLGAFAAAPLILAAVGFRLIFHLNRFINVAYARSRWARTSRSSSTPTSASTAVVRIREGRRAVTNGARLQGNGSQRFGTVTHRDRVPPPPRATGDG